MVSMEELQQMRQAVVDALDALIAKMGCQKKVDGTERRMQNGPCQILPLDPKLLERGVF